MFLRSYNPLKGYLERWTVFKVGRLHVRFHQIKRNDATPFLHSHPFSYVSFIVKGGYTETLETSEKKHKRFSIICRSHKTYHRIKTVLPNTLTLFIAYTPKGAKWDLKPLGSNVEEWVSYPTGVYQRSFKDGAKYCKFDGFWYKAAASHEQALKETVPSINQTLKPI